MPKHPASWARVNAPVDRAIVPFVEALSSFPRLETLEAMSLSLLKFVGQASLVDDAMLPS